MPITDRDSDARAEPLSASAERIVNDLGRAIAEIGEGASQGDIDGCLGRALERSAHGWNTIPWGTPGECCKKLVVVFTRAESVRQLLSEAARHVVFNCPRTEFVLFVLAQNFQSWPIELARFLNAIEIFRSEIRTETRVLGTVDVAPVWHQDISLQLVAACILFVAERDRFPNRDGKLRFTTSQVRKLISSRSKNISSTNLNAQIQPYVRDLLTKNLIELEENQNRQRNRFFRVLNASALRSLASGVKLATPYEASKVTPSESQNTRIENIDAKVNELFRKLDAIRDILS